MLYIFNVIFIILLFYNAVALATALKLLCSNIHKKPFKTYGYNEYDFKKFNPKDLKIINAKGKTLYGKIFKQDNTRGLIILCHGYTSNYYFLMSRAKVFLELNYDVFLYHHFYSSQFFEQKCSMGYFESEDLECVVQNFSKEYETIITYGLSMGASTVLLHCGKYQSVYKCIAESPYWSLKNEILYRLKCTFKIALPFIYPLIRFYLCLFGKFDADEVDVVEQLKQNTVPIFLIHGTNDTYVPTESSLKIQKTCANIKGLYLCQGAKHTNCIDVNPVEYKNEIRHFLSTL